jgi:hypothetical protein
LEGGAPLLKMWLFRHTTATKRCAVGDDTSKRAIGASPVEEPVLAEVGLPLEELIRRGARDILQRAIEAQVQVLLEQYEAVSLLDGRRAVVRNGDSPARAILTVGKRGRSPSLETRRSASGYRRCDSESSKLLLPY